MDLPLDIVFAQINPTVGALDQNFEKIRHVCQAHDAADLIVFSECITTGYPAEDLVLNDGFMKSVERRVDELLTALQSLSPAILLPTPWREGGKLYNAALFIEGGKITRVLKKHDLPNYDVFDEKRIFAAGDLALPVDYKGCKLGIMICEDMWQPATSAHLRDNGAEILIVVNGSPYHDRIDTLRTEQAKARVTETGLPLIYLNQVGGQDELVFDGRSFGMDETGKITFTFPAFQECVRSVNKAGVESSLSKDEEIYTALVTGLHDYVQKNGFNGVLIGMSGGIDSALSAVIATDALGAENVQCVMMPSIFTSADSLDDARLCAEMLGAPYDVIPIKSTVTALENTLANHINPTDAPLAFENIQSRARGLILMALSNANGKMLLSTGNKSEMAVGYATLYGDMCGGYNALKDVYKTQVYALSHWRNAQGEVIPDRILTKAPSAELKHDQTDQDSLPPYDVLDDILRALIEQDRAPVKISHPEAMVKDVWRMLDRAEYKRRQAPPGPKITARAFGRDRRYPITNGYFTSKQER
jgi:NAD+ synthase